MQYMINARSILRHLDTNDLGAFGWDWYIDRINQEMSGAEWKAFRRRIQKRTKAERQIWAKTGVIYSTIEEAIEALKSFHAEWRKNYGTRPSTI